MSRVCYGFDWNDTDFIFAIKRVEQSFACFVVLDDINDDYGEVAIIARECDIPAIEEMLAPYI